MIESVSFRTNTVPCTHCTYALRTFLGRLPGVGEVDTEADVLTVRFDAELGEEQQIRKIARESLERLGYRAEEV